ncbi:MAG TPA: DUF4332 domain-containing protein [Lacipirellulaceae bacterium]|nr:DUF4332 domain-containing protein [Lacipirellulaceae bacterium]
MKVTQIRLAGQGALPSLGLAGLSPELTVLVGPAQSGKTSVAQLAAHLLYGKTSTQVPSGAGLAEGSLDIRSPDGQFVLRRHRDGSPWGRLTVAAPSGAAADSRTVRALLGGLPAGLLAELFAVDFAAGPRAKSLLDESFARQFALALPHEQGESPALGAVCQEHAPATPGTHDRRRIDELARRRDDVARQIEQQMSETRSGSAALEQEISRVDALLARRRSDADEAATRLHAVEAKLADVAARLRYQSLQSAVRPLPPGDDAARRGDLERLEAEASRCRQMLADLQSRETCVRRELAEVHPDGTADSVAGLAEQRATVGLLERLIDDLDAEVAGLARSHEPGRCIAADAHTRMLPVAQMLRRQVYALCGQVTEQERTARRVQLRAELRQLGRAQSDLSEQLEHLLERRQALIHDAQIAGRGAASAPQAPVAGHCRCEQHDRFTARSPGMLLAAEGRGPDQDKVRQQRIELEAQRHQLCESRDQFAAEIATLAAEWERLQQERAQVAGRSSLDDLRSELGRLEDQLHRALHSGAAVAPFAAGAGGRRPWKASDTLAQLTGGQLTQVRLGRDGRGATIVDRTGRLLVPEDLSPQQNDQLYLALVLALTSSLGARGIELPLVLDEPFLRQDSASAAAMAGVLVEFAREGRQTLVFTKVREAQERFAALGADVRDIDELRRASPSARTPPIASTPTPAPKPAAPSLRVVRHPVDDGPAPPVRTVAERTAAAIERAAEKPVYYLTVDASLADFPVLGNETAMIFTSLGMRTVEDLLAADAAEVARRLAHPSVTVDAVRLWQQHTSLMCFVPSVSLADAQVLAACEVTSPEALFTIDARLLADAVTKFLATDRGRRFASCRDRLSRDRLVMLQKLARRQRDRWQLLSPRFPWVERPTAAPKTRPRPVPALRMRHSKGAGTPATPRIVKETRRRPLRFFLDRRSPVAEAPSIGATIAERLTEVGIRTVADLLNANPESTAAELGIRRVTPEAIAAWQVQARLACRIPELRGGGAQILAACGFTEPEQVARVSVAELMAKVRAVCHTAQGKRMLRDSEPPTEARIAGWIRHASQTRPLEAA